MKHSRKSLLLYEIALPLRQSAAGRVFDFVLLDTYVATKGLSSWAHTVIGLLPV